MKSILLYFQVRNIGAECHLPTNNFTQLPCSNSHEFGLKVKVDVKRALCLAMGHWQ